MCICGVFFFIIFPCVIYVWKYNSSFIYAEIVIVIVIIIIYTNNIQKKQNKKTTIIDDAASSTSKYQNKWY